MLQRTVRLILAIAASMPIGGAAQDITSNRLLIGHAFGAIERAVYTNSLDAFKANYGKKCHYLEADLWKAADEKIVLFHNKFEKNLGLEQGFNSSAFKAARFNNRYTTLDIDDLVDLFKRYADWTLITDAKNGNAYIISTLCEKVKAAGVSCSKRIIPQIYAPEELPAIAALGFSKIIFTLYRTKMDDTAVTAFVESHPEIWAITASTERYTQTLARRLKGLTRPVLLLVHTINSPQKLLQLPDVQLIDGLYTDTLCQ